MGVKKVILIHTADLLQQANALAKTYKLYQIKTEFYKISSAWDINMLRQELERLLIVQQPEITAINLTIGTKPISIILHDIASTLKIPAYYINTDDSLAWFLPKELNAKPPEFLGNRIKIKQFLMAHGKELIDSSTPDSHKPVRELLNEMVDNIQKYTKAIPQLNYLASLSTNLVSPEINIPDDAQNRGFYDLIAKFEAVGLLSRQGSRLVFSDEQARFFANGGWLEEFIFHQTKKLSSKIREITDYLCGAQVQTVDGVKNEIDNLMLIKNKLYLIECKTKRFNNNGKPDGGAVQAIYKLDNLIDMYGGVFGKGMVVSVFNMSPADKKRAEKNNIKVITLLELKQFQKHLSDWILQK